MTRKHFNAVAELLRGYRDLVDAVTFNDLVHGFVNYFVEENPKFDSDKFIGAVWK
jgi:hypothetical protein